jgi:hypothetical protein
MTSSTYAMLVETVAASPSEEASMQYPDGGLFLFGQSAVSAIPESIDNFFNAR